MADELITKQELIDAKPDVKNLGEAANGNETGIVTPRYGAPYSTAPAAIQKIESDGANAIQAFQNSGNATIQSFQTEANEAISKVENTGGFISAPTLAALQAITPEYDYQLARVDATGDEYRWNPALTTTVKWELTGRNFLSESKAYTDTKASDAQATAIAAAALDASNKANAAELNAEKTVLDAITTQTAKTLSQKQGNAYIVTDGSTATSPGRYIYSFAVQAKEMYRILNNLVSSSIAQRSYAFYSSTTISAANFISGGAANTSARTADDFVIVPTNAVMLCISSNSTIDAQLFLLDLKNNTTVTDLAATSTKNSVVLQNRKRVRNQLDSLFESKVNFFRDLTTDASAPITTNSNTTDPAYNFSPRIANEDTTNVIAYTEATDANVGYIREFTANYGFTASKLIPIGSILEKTKIIFGLRISAAVAAAALIEISDGSGNTSRYNLTTGIADSFQNNAQASEFALLGKSGDYYVYSVTYAGSTNASQQNCRIAVRNTTATSGTFSVGLFGVKAFKYADNYNYYLDTPYSNTENSPFLKKNLMYFGDSQSRGNIAFEFMRQLGCNVWWNAAGGRAMKYRQGQSSQSDQNWLYHWSRRQHILNAISVGGEFALYVFNASYNDGAGGGTLSDSAIQAVLDNYPTITDDATTVTNKLAIFNALTETQRESIFGFKQTFAAMLKQIIEYQPNAKVFLTTLLYNPEGGGTSEAQRNAVKATRDSCNADIRAIAEYFGVSLINVNQHAGHYFGNMKTHTPSDNLHFDEVIGKRIGYFTAKNILMQTV